MAEEAAIKINTPMENIDGNPMAPAIVPVTLPGPWLVGLDMLCRHLSAGPGPVMTRGLLLSALLDRELAARGLLGDPRCHHSFLGRPEGITAELPDGQPCGCGRPPEKAACGTYVGATKGSQ